MNQKEPSNRKNLKLALLAGTCLTTSASLASAASTITESGDFSNDLSGALLSPLPVGTDVVIGNINITGDPADFVSFTSLSPGSPFSISFGSGFLNYDVVDSTGTHVGTPGTLPAGISAAYSGNVPANGILVAKVGNSEGGSYTINLTATTVPETGSAALAGLGVAAAALRRSRRSKIDS